MTYLFPSSLLRWTRAAVPIAFSALFLSPTVASANEQCVYKDSSLYNSIVRWYPPGSLTIDNSEPWNNRILFARRTDKSGASGIDVETGERVWQGAPISALRTDRLNLRNPQSCMPGSTGEHVAIVHCVGCTQGVDFLIAATDFLVGSTLNVVTGPLSLSKVIDAAQVAAGSQGLSTKAALEEVVSGRADGLKLGETLKRGVPIHDISDLHDLPDPKNLVYFGTPKALLMKGAIGSPRSIEAGFVQPPHIAWRYQVKIDCNHIHPSIGNEGTTNTIEVDFYAQGRLLREVARDGKDLSCRGWQIFSANGYTSNGRNLPPFDKVVISTTGNDAFFIDMVDIRQIAVRGGSSSRNLSSLTFYNNAKSDNRCLSTDPMDGSRTWKNHIPGQRCTPTLEIPFRSRRP